MELFVGIVLGTVLSMASIYFMDRIRYSPRQIKVMASQSHIDSLYAQSLIDYKALNTQAVKHASESQVRVLFTEKNAYWIRDNQVYCADISDGLILEESAKVLDMINMDKVQLEEIIFIIDKLTEGISNDYRYPRD